MLSKETIVWIAFVSQLAMTPAIPDASDQDLESYCAVRLGVFESESFGLRALYPRLYGCIEAYTHVVTHGNRMMPQAK